MDDSNRTCASAAAGVEPTEGGGREGGRGGARQDGGGEGKGEACEETKGNTAGTGCVTVGWAVGRPQRAVTPTNKSALKMAPRRSSTAPVTT